jgi:hypothetical protein
MENGSAASVDKLPNALNAPLARLEFNPDFILLLIGSMNLNDRGRVGSSMLQYQPWPGVWLKVRGEFFVGKAESFYGNWNQNNRLVTSLEYSF